MALTTHERTTTSTQSTGTAVVVIDSFTPPTSTGASCVHIITWTIIGRSTTGADRTTIKLVEDFAKIGSAAPVQDGTATVLLQSGTVNSSAWQVAVLLSGGSIQLTGQWTGAGGTINWVVYREVSSHDS